jgi:hypothetical protein
LLSGWVNTMANQTKLRTDRERVEAFVRRQAEMASSRYLAWLDTELRGHAVMDMSSHRVQRLTKDALALCGHPIYAFSHTCWSEAVWRFLASLVDDLEESR